MIAKHDGTEVFQAGPADAGMMYLPVPGGVVIITPAPTLLPGVRLVYDFIDNTEANGYTNVRLEEDEDRKTDRADREADRLMRSSLKDVAVNAMGVAQSFAIENGFPIAEPPRKLKVVDDETPTAWTAEERIEIASRLLQIIQDDIPAGHYSEFGRPNIQSVMHVLHESAEVLNQYQEELREILEKNPI